METLVVAYEREQIDAIAEYVTHHRDAEVVAFDYWVERELAMRGIPVRPLSDYIPQWADFSGLLRRIENLCRHWYKLPEVAFLQHHGLSLGEMTETALYMYLQQVRGYMHIFEQITNKHPYMRRVVVPYSSKTASPTSGPLAMFEVEVVVSVARWWAGEHGFAFTVLGESRNVAAMPFPSPAPLRRMLLRAYNALISMVQPQRSIRIYVSDHWRNIKAIVERMHDTELVFVDRKELRSIPWRSLLKHRVRFIHPLDVLTPEMRSLARERQREFQKKWQEAKVAIQRLPEFSLGKGNWWPIVEPAFSYLAEVYAERIVADIESIAATLVRERINRTLIRASISGQHHFFILGELPRQFDIPSLEIQHGIGPGTIHPHSVFGLLHTDYLAAYGPMIRRAFIRNGYAPERIIPTGSPRFDRYFTERDSVTREERDRRIAALGLVPSKPVVLVVMPAENTGFPLGSIDLTSYEFRDYLLSLRDMQRIVPGTQYVLKFRSRQHAAKYRFFLGNMFPQGSIAIESGDLFSYALLSDIVISSFSTAVGECLMARKPVVLYPLKAGETYFYEAHKGGVVTVPLLDVQTGIPLQELSNEIRRLLTDTDTYAGALQRGERYLAENFSFTGSAASTVADFVRTASAPPKAETLP